MSAFMVSATHIDALLTAGLSWTDPAPLRWYDQPIPAEVHQQGRPWGSGFLDWAKHHTRELTEHTAGQVGAMLLAENRRSVDHRHAHADRERPYRFTRLPGTPDPATVYHALGCYEAQASEHPGWRESEAQAFCRELEVRAVGQLIRHDHTWAITDPDVFVNPTRR